MVFVVANADVSVEAVIEDAYGDDGSDGATDIEKSAFRPKGIEPPALSRRLSSMAMLKPGADASSPTALTLGDTVPAARLLVLGVDAATDVHFLTQMLRPPFSPRTTTFVGLEVQFYRTHTHTHTHTHHWHQV